MRKEDMYEFAQKYPLDFATHMGKYCFWLLACLIVIAIVNSTRLYTGAQAISLASMLGPASIIVLLPIVIVFVFFLPFIIAQFKCLFSLIRKNSNKEEISEYKGQRTFLEKAYIVAFFVTLLLFAICGFWFVLPFMVVICIFFWLPILIALTIYGIVKLCHKIKPKE